MAGVRDNVEFENEQVRVVHYHFAPHATIPMHQAPDVVAVWLTDAQLKLTFPDGVWEVEKHKAGEIAWRPAQQHAGENLADSPLEFIAVQLKTGAGEPLNKTASH
jgi:quercetin dioxygenase-like cupin family protein